MSSWNLGHLVEGTLEQDPFTDHYVIQTVDAKGNPVTFELEKALKSLVGREVRFTLASFEDLTRLAQLVEERGGAEVQGLAPIK